MFRHFTRMIFTLLMLFALAAVALAQDEGDSYTDPDGFFTVPVPTNWVVVESENYVTLNDPDALIDIHFLVFPDGEDREGLIAAAWEIVDPEFDLESIDVTEITDPALLEGTDYAMVITYGTGPAQIVQASLNAFDGVAYVGLYKFNLMTLQQRVAQVQTILTGYTINALEKEDISGTPARPVDDEIIAEMEAFINEMLTFGEIPGASLAIVQGGEVVYSGGFGVLENGDDAPVTADTLMMIGSTTKTMTTLAMAALVDDGLMDWDTRVVDLLPSFAVADPVITEQLTVRNLVCACTGVPRRDLELIFNAEELTAEDIVDSLAGFEFFTDFGEAFQYSNQMVAMGGYAAALADGAAYGGLFEGYLALIQERILDPIGMSSSTFDFDVVQAGNYATPHSVNIDQEYLPIPLDYERFVLPIPPAGGLWSSANDMAQYLITLLNEGASADGTQVVSFENLNETWQPQIQISATLDYGLGWIIEDYKGLLILGHNGNTLGFTSEMAIIPDADLGIIFLTNAQATNSISSAVRTRLLELVYDQEPQAEATLRALMTMAEASAQAPNFGELDEEAVAPYLGEWFNDALGSVTVALVDGLLYGDAGEFSSELRPLLNDEDEIRFYITVDPPIVGADFYFREDDDGNPIIVLGSGVVEYVFEKVD